MGCQRIDSSFNSMFIIRQSKKFGVKVSKDLMHLWDAIIVLKLKKCDVMTHIVDADEDIFRVQQFCLRIPVRKSYL